MSIDFAVFHNNIDPANWDNILFGFSPLAINSLLALLNLPMLSTTPGSSLEMAISPACMLSANSENSLLSSLTESRRLLKPSLILLTS